jgi:hypothetical protein
MIPDTNAGAEAEGEDESEPRRSVSRAENDRTDVDAGENVDEMTQELRKKRYTSMQSLSEKLTAELVRDNAKMEDLKTQVENLAGKVTSLEDNTVLLNSIFLTPKTSSFVMRSPHI